VTQLNLNPQEAQDLIKILARVIQSHCDTPIADILSGQPIVWHCAGELEDLRETVGQQGLLEEFNYELSKDVARLEGEITVLRTGIQDVPPEEQLEIVKRWIRDGGA